MAIPRAAFRNGTNAVELSFSLVYVRHNDRDRTARYNPWIGPLLSLSDQVSGLGSGRRHTAVRLLATHGQYVGANAAVAGDPNTSGICLKVPLS